MQEGLDPKSPKSNNSPEESAKLFQSQSLNSPDKLEKLGSIDISHLISKVQAFNSQFTMGAFVSSLIQGMLVEQSVAGLIEEKSVDRSLLFMELSSEIGVDLKRTGLSLVDAATDFSVSSGSETFKVTQLTFGLANPTLFTEYLKVLSFENTSSSQREGLMLLGPHFRQHFVGQLGTETDNNRISEELKVSGRAIVDHYLRIACDPDSDLSKSVESLSKIVRLAEQGVLVESVIAEYFTLDKPYDAETSALNFHSKHFLETERVKNAWLDVVRALTILSKNSLADQIYAQAFEIAEAALNAAIVEVLDADADVFSDKPGLLTVFSEIQTSLQDLEN